MRYFKFLQRSFFVLIIASIVVLPAGVTHAASGSLKVAGWIPYWRDAQGIKDAKAHLSSINTLHPFVFSAQSDGSIKDLSKAGLESEAWQSLFRAAQKKRVEIIPTVMWSSGDSIHAVLSDPATRALHVGVIAAMVAAGKYDGVDIDYENKKAETKDYFSQFLRELKVALKGKLLTCAIEARTPPDSLYKVVPEVIEYSNDYAVIGQVCDRIEIMGYDQQRADIKLNAARTGAPYMPVADIDWVQKVMDFAAKSLPKDKLMLGMPTYGNHYQVIVSPDWYQDYKRIGALNAPDLVDIAKKYKVKPSRNSAGEMSFTYFATSSQFFIPSSIKAPRGTASGNVAAARALEYANQTGQTVTVRFASWSDAGAIAPKLSLAKKLGLRGVAFFKFDGEEDKKIWKLLKK